MQVKENRSFRASLPAPVLNAASAEIWHKTRVSTQETNRVILLALAGHVSAFQTRYLAYLMMIGDYSATHNTRKPLLLLRFEGSLLLRLAERQFVALLFHEPPRKTRDEPDC